MNRFALSLTLVIRRVCRRKQPDGRAVIITDVLRTIRSVARGSTVLPLFLIGSARTTTPGQQVIGPTAHGRTNKEIAPKLHLPAHAVKSRIHNIHGELALRTRVRIAKDAHDIDTFRTAASINTV